MERVPMTVEGFRTLEGELQRLKSEERPRIIQAIAEARAHGDLSENAEYHAAKEQQGFNEARVADIEDSSAAPRSSTPRSCPATREVRRHRDAGRRGHRREGEIQDRRRLRGDVNDGKISITSPIARALIGKSKNNTVEVTTPGGGSPTRSSRSSSSSAGRDRLVCKARLGEDRAQGGGGLRRPVPGPYRPVTSSRAGHTQRHVSHRHTHRRTKWT